MQIHHFKDIISPYSTIFFDAYGVLKNHSGLLPGVLETFSLLDTLGKDYYILTNDASRSPKALAEGYQSEGLVQITEQKIISSLMLASEFLQLKVTKGIIACIGTTKSIEYLTSFGLKAISIKEISDEHLDDMAAVIFLDDEGFDWSKDLNKTVNILRSTNIPAVVANTDTSYPASSDEINIAVGSLAGMVERIVSKNFIHFGKPDSQLFLFAYQHAMQLGSTPDKRKFLMVGDTLSTDIIGANKFGLDTALVLTGNTTQRLAETQINSQGIFPNFVCPSIAG
ncbi:MAG: HAD-IIA family hydrolase [Bacteroidota bacterium]